MSLVQKMGNIGTDQGTSLQIFTDDFDKVDSYTHLLQQHLNEATVRW